MSNEQKHSTLIVIYVTIILFILLTEQVDISEEVNLNYIALCSH